MIRDGYRHVEVTVQGHVIVAVQCVCLRCKFLNQELIIMLHTGEMKQPNLHFKKCCQARFYKKPPTSEKIAKMMQSPAKFESKLMCNFVRSLHIFMLCVIEIKCFNYHLKKSYQNRFFKYCLSLKKWSICSTYLKIRAK